MFNSFIFNSCILKFKRNVYRRVQTLIKKFLTNLINDILLFKQAINDIDETIDFDLNFKIFIYDLEIPTRNTDNIFLLSNCKHFESVRT